MGKGVSKQMKELPKKTIENICQIGKGAKTCRYLVFSGGGFLCAKTDQKLKAAIDAQVKSMNAQGDNCAGDGEEYN